MAAVRFFRIDDMGDIPATGARQIAAAFNQDTGL